MAAPHVAGVAALYLQTNPSASSSTVAQQVLSSATSGIVWNTDGVSANKLVNTSFNVAPAPEPVRSRVTIIKKVTNKNGGTASTAMFDYSATNLGTSFFELVDNDTPPADRYENPDVPMPESDVAATVTELAMSGWQLDSIECVETAGTGLTNLQNSTVDLVNRKANIKLEPGESVTCTFNSTERAPLASLSGRIVDSRGRAVGGLQVTVTRTNGNQSWSAVTNTFGYYTVNGLATGNSYKVVAKNNRYSISPNSLTVSLASDISNLNFVANPR
jgi:hypothetical protein